MIGGLPLTSTVFTLHANVIYLNSEQSKTRIYSKPWKTTFDCNIDSRYLNCSSSDLSKWGCAKCPKGASCAGKVTWNGVKAKFGYWHIPNTLHFTECLRPQSCLGAANNLFYDRFKLAHENSNVSCAQPAFVPGSRLCATCARPNYARGSGKGSCEKCSKVWNLIVFITSIVFGLAGFTVLLRLTLFERRKVKLSDGVKKIGINYLQFASLALNLNLPWSRPLQQLFQWQNYGVSISNAMLSLDCVLAETHTTFEVFELKFFSTLLLPFIFVPIGYGIVRFILNGGRNESMAALILFWYLMYPSIIKSITTLVACTGPIGGTKRYLILDPEIECFNYSSYVWVGLVSGLVFYVVGLPLFSILTLKRMDRDDAGNRLKYGILYDGYESQTFWWWEGVIQLRKLGVILVTTFVESLTQQVLLVLFIIVCSLFFTAVLKPFYDDRLTQLEMLSLGICFLTFFLGAFFLSDEKCVEENEALCVIGEWLVIVTNISGAAVLSYNFSQSWFLEKKGMLSKVYGWVQNKLKCCCCVQKEDGVLERRHSYVEMQGNMDGDEGVLNGGGGSGEYQRL